MLQQHQYVHSARYQQEFLSQGWSYYHEQDLYWFYDEFFIDGEVLRMYLKENNKPFNRIHIVEGLNVIYSTILEKS